MLLKEHTEQLVRHDILWNCILAGLLVKVSIASIERIRKESQQEQGILPSPPKRYFISCICMDADSFDREAL